MKDLADWRKRIDEIDQQLVKLLNERSLCAVEVGKIKKVLRLAAWQPEREAEILRNVVKSNPGPLDDAAIRRLFERIIDEARALERHIMASEIGKE
ncbi:MAG: chorismate mutase [Acidobacteria bacterium]|nr:MAG: chorismate mutase [Acidobacteriota bacterium]